MLTFFRKIRQSIFGLNLSHRYFIYAAGEIALVVIGILIALQINNWNQNRLDSNEEQELLGSIYNSTSQYLWLSERGIERHNRVIAAAERLLLAFNHPKSDRNYIQIDQDLHDVYSIRWLTGAGTSTNIYDVLIGGGKLGLISSKQLQEELASLKEEYGYLNIYEGIQVQFIDHQLSPFLNTKIDRLTLSAEKLRLNKELFNSPFKTEYDTLFNDKKFANLLVELIKHTKTLIGNYIRINSCIYNIDSLVMVGNPTLKKKR
jgi:hypothetical protein